jgi:hypothetical protein
MLRRLWDRWKTIAQIIGDFQARFLLTLFYFVIIPPAALMIRAFSDPLQLKPPRGASMWMPRASEPPSLDDARRQF